MEKTTLFVAEASEQEKTKLEKLYKQVEKNKEEELNPQAKKMIDPTLVAKGKDYEDRLTFKVKVKGVKQN